MLSVVFSLLCVCQCLCVWVCAWYVWSGGVSREILMFLYAQILLRSMSTYTTIFVIKPIHNIIMNLLLVCWNFKAFVAAYSHKQGQGVKGYIQTSLFITINTHWNWLRKKAKQQTNNGLKKVFLANSFAFVNVTDTHTHLSCCLHTVLARVQAQRLSR